MNKTIFTETYKVRSTQVNLNNQLGLYGVLGMLQDIASEHASYLGFGYKQLVQKGFFWALIQQHLKMDYWPGWNERITVKTWSLPVQGVYAFREFELYWNDKKIGECASTWITMDIQSRKPIELSGQQEIFFPRTDGSLNFKTQRISLPSDMYQVNEFGVKVSDLDMNSHVNNVKYSQWALDMMNERAHREWVIKEYAINFLSETFMGDQMQGFKSKGKYLSDTLVETFHYAQKIGAAKPAFISHWTAERINK